MNAEDVKSWTAHGGVFRWPPCGTVKAPEAAGPAVRMLGSLLTDIGGELRETAGAAVLVWEENPSLPPEGYTLCITPAAVTVAFADTDGARHAAATLYQTLEKDADGYFLPCGEAEDAPDSRFRGVLLDMARKYLEPGEVKTTLRQMALAKMNRVIFHLMDAERYALQSDAWPQLNGGCLRQYTKEQLRELVDCAAFWGIQVIPSVDLPGHATFLLDRMPELDCAVDEPDFQRSRWAVCVGNEEVYRFAEGLFRELLEIFDGVYIMCPGDEVEFIPLNLWVNWEHCARCKALAAREHLADKQALFDCFVRRIHAILQGLGTRMIVANDNFEIREHPDLPRDLLIFWWHRRLERHPDNTMACFLRQGFEVINSDVYECYLDLYMTQEKLSDWTPVKRPECPPECAGQVVGGCMCAWEGKAHYAWTLPPAIQMMGEKLWDFRNRVYDTAYARRLTRRLLGPDTPPGADIFTYLGACLPPLTADSSQKGFVGRVTDACLPELERMTEMLECFAGEPHREAPLAAVYADCLRWMRQRREESVDVVE